MIGEAEKAVEQRADGLEAARRVGHEEDEDDDGRDAHEDVAAVAETLGVELGYRHRPHADAVAAQTARDQQPVHIGADAQTQDRPEGIGQTRDVGQAGNAHQQPRTHVGSLGTHGGHEGAQLASAQIKLVGVGGLLPAVVVAHIEHDEQVDRKGGQDKRLGHEAMSFLELTLSRHRNQAATSVPEMLW